MSWGQRKSWPKNAKTSLKSLRQSEFCGTYVGRVPTAGDYLCEMPKPHDVGQHCDNPIRHMGQPIPFLATSPVVPQNI